MSGAYFNVGYLAIGKAAVVIYWLTLPLIVLRPLVWVAKRI